MGPGSRDEVIGQEFTSVRVKFIIASITAGFGIQDSIRGGSRRGCALLCNCEDLRYVKSLTQKVPPFRCHHHSSQLSANALSPDFTPRTFLDSSALELLLQIHWPRTAWTQASLMSKCLTSLLLFLVPNCF